VEDAASGETKVHKHYSSSDVERFAKGSNVKTSDVDYDEEEDLVISAEGTPTSARQRSRRRTDDGSSLRGYADTSPTHSGEEIFCSRGGHSRT